MIIDVNISTTVTQPLKYIWDHHKLLMLTQQQILKQESQSSSRPFTGYISVLDQGTLMVNDHRSVLLDHLLNWWDCILPTQTLEYLLRFYCWYQMRLRRNMLRNVYVLSGSRQLMTVVSGWFLIADIRAAQVLTKSEILVSTTTYSGHPFFFNA